jgi:hypothetical protein
MIKNIPTSTGTDDQIGEPSCRDISDAEWNADGDGAYVIFLSRTNDTIHTVICAIGSRVDGGPTGAGARDAIHIGTISNETSCCDCRVNACNNGAVP